MTDNLRRDTGRRRWRSGAGTVNCRGERRSILPDTGDTCIVWVFPVRAVEHAGCIRAIEDSEDLFQTRSWLPAGCTGSTPFDYRRDILVRVSSHPARDVLALTSKYSKQKLQEPNAP